MPKHNAGLQHIYPTFTIAMIKQQFHVLTDFTLVGKKNSNCVQNFD